MVFRHPPPNDAGDTKRDGARGGLGAAGDLSLLIIIIIIICRLRQRLQEFNHVTLVLIGQAQAETAVIVVHNIQQRAKTPIVGEATLWHASTGRSEVKCGSVCPGHDPPGGCPRRLRSECAQPGHIEIKHNNRSHWSVPEPDRLRHQ